MSLQRPRQLILIVRPLQGDEAMTWYMRIVLGGIVCLVFTTVSVGQDPQKTKVELRWLEDKRIERLTEEKGFQVSDTPDGVAYPHKKPALVLTAAEMDGVQMRKHDFSG